MNVAERESLLRSLLAPHLPPEGDAGVILSDRSRRPDHVDPLTFELLCSMMIWEHEVMAGVDAACRLLASVIDLNDLRVTRASEMSLLIGVDYPLSLDRCERLREVLNSIYEREDCVSIAPLSGRPKRAAEEFLACTHGLCPFAQARVLLAMGVSALPIDGRALTPMIRAGVFSADTNAHSARAWVERRLSTAELPRYAVAVERYGAAESAAAASKPKPKRRPRTPAKKPVE